jgi:hypothetical protein
MKHIGTLSEALLERAEQHLNLNHATGMPWKPYPFCPLVWVRALSYYLYRYGPW